jgi:hypothetical protein
MTKSSRLSVALPPAVGESPPILFVSKVEKLSKTDGVDVDKTKLIKFEFFMHPGNPASKYSRQLEIFKDGWPEKWIKWLMAFRQMESLMLLKESVDKTRMYRTLVKGQALSYFEHHLRKRLDAEASEILDNFVSMIHEDDMIVVAGFFRLQLICLPIPQTIA